MAKAHVYGDHIDTDVIIPARYLNNADPAALAVHCMEDIDPDFGKKVVPGDILVAGVNFGCGSSREHAPIALRAAGISAVVAAGFARIFYRNAINIGLPIIVCPDAVKTIENGDDLFLDPKEGKLENRTKGLWFSTEPFPPFLQDIIAKGGLLASWKQ